MEEYDCKFFDEIPQKQIIQTTEEEIYHHYLPKKVNQVPWTTYSYGEDEITVKKEEFYLKIAEKPEAQPHFFDHFKEKSKIENKARLVTEDIRQLMEKFELEQQDKSMKSQQITEAEEGEEEEQEPLPPA